MLGFRQTGAYARSERRHPDLEPDDSGRVSLPGDRGSRQSALMATRRSRDHELVSKHDRTPTAQQPDVIAMALQYRLYRPLPGRKSRSIDLSPDIPSGEHIDKTSRTVANKPGRLRSAPDDSATQGPWIAASTRT